MKNLLFISFLLFFDPLLLHAQTDTIAGKSIFQSRCASCHSLKQEMTGPALKDVDKRRKPEWIVKFVQSSQTIISSGDADAKSLFAKYQTIMPDHKDLKEADVQNIIAFVKTESARLDKEALNNPIKRPKEVIPNNKPLVWATDWWVFVVYGFFLFLLVYVLSFVINVNELKKKTNN